jgi:hypothetical protein
MSIVGLDLAGVQTRPTEYCKLEGMQLKPASSTKTKNCRKIFSEKP